MNTKGEREVIFTGYPTNFSSFNNKKRFKEILIPLGTIFESKDEKLVFKNVALFLEHVKTQDQERERGLRVFSKVENYFDFLLRWVTSSVLSLESGLHKDKSLYSYSEGSIHMVLSLCFLDWIQKQENRQISKNLSNACEFYNNLERLVLVAPAGIIRNRGKQDDYRHLISCFKKDFVSLDTVKMALLKLLGNDKYVDDKRKVTIDPNVVLNYYKSVLSVVFDKEIDARVWATVSVNIKDLIKTVLNKKQIIIVASDFDDRFPYKEVSDAMRDVGNVRTIKTKEKLKHLEFMFAEKVFENTLRSVQNF